MEPIPSEPQQLSALESAFRRALAEHDLASEALPPLRDDPSVLDRYRGSIEDLLRGFLEKLFPHKPRPQLSDGFWQTLGDVLLYAGVVVLIAILAWVVWKHMTASKRPSPARLGPPGEGAAEFFPADAKLGRRIEAAVAAGRFSEAGRLRWKLFLLRLVMPPTCTPLEYRQRYAHATLSPDQPKIDWKAFLDREYELMFHDSRATRESYVWTDRLLVDIEKRARAKRAGGAK